MKITNSELDENQQVLLLELISNTTVILLSNNSKIIAYSDKPNNFKPPLTCHDDWWLWTKYGIDCCMPFFGAKCCTYGPGIVCNDVQN